MVPRGRAAPVRGSQGRPEEVEQGLPPAFRERFDDWDTPVPEGQMRAGLRDPYVEALGVGAMVAEVVDLVSARRGNLGRCVWQGETVVWQRWSPHAEIALEIAAEALGPEERAHREAWCTARGVLYLWPEDGRMLDVGGVQLAAAEWRRKRPVLARGT